MAAHRRGPFGVETLNRLIIESLDQKGRIEAGAEHFDGRPILIVENEPRLELFNGDLGMVCRENGQLWAFFPSPDGSAPRRLSLSLLPRHETAFAMTIHKSQGSEFDRVCIVLPSNASVLLSRELLYTAVSRARRQVDIHGTEAIVKLASALSERES